MTNNSGNNRLDTLTAKRDQLNAQIQALRAREQAQKRKDDTRRKVLIGSVFLKMIKAGEMKQEQLDRILDKHLEKERDRALFGLPIKLAQSALSPSGEAQARVDHPQVQARDHDQQDHR